MTQPIIKKNYNHFTSPKSIDVLLTDYYYHGEKDSGETRKRTRNLENKTTKEFASLKSRETSKENVKRSSSFSKSSKSSKSRQDRNRSKTPNRNRNEQRSESGALYKISHKLSHSRSMRETVQSDTSKSATNKSSASKLQGLTNVPNGTTYIQYNHNLETSLSSRKSNKSFQTWMDSYGLLSEPYEFHSPKSSLQKQPFLVRQSQSKYISSPFANAAPGLNRFSSRQKPLYSNGKQNSVSSPKQDIHQAQYLMTENGIVSPPFTRSNKIPKETHPTTNTILKSSLSSAIKPIPSSKLKLKHLSAFSTSMEQLIKKLNLNATKTYLSLEYHPLWKDLARESSEVHCYANNTALREKWNQLPNFFRKKKTVVGMDGKKVEEFDKQFNSNLWIKYVKNSLIQEMGRSDDSKSKKHSDYDTSLNACFEMAHEEFFVITEEDDQTFKQLKIDISKTRMKQKMANHVLLLLGQLAEYCAVIDSENQLLLDESQYWNEQIQDQEKLHNNLLNDRKRIHAFLKSEDEKAEQIMKEIEELENEKNLIHEMIEHRKNSM